MDAPCCGNGGGSGAPCGGGSTSLLSAAAASGRLCSAALAAEEGRSMPGRATPEQPPPLPGGVRGAMAHCQKAWRLHSLHPWLQRHRPEATGVPI
mmetsp:Transcript_61250/g.138178  ORF Transcript_61250/g.138178 Transcript_61250/m.138178 type:complete len:95 (+) Transcript_61250:1670-1954(+)